MRSFSLFSTPVFVTDLPDIAGLCAALTSDLLGRAAQSEGIQASNHGGAWHSVPDLAQDPDEPWPTVTRLVVAACRGAHDALAAANGQDASADDLDVAVQLWGMVMPAGGYAAPHAHHEAGWSCAFYADPGDAEAPIAFLDPRRAPARSGGRTLYPSTFTVQPALGRIVVFPGWLQHFVHTYTGTRPRVSLSANVTFSPPSARRPR